MMVERKTQHLLSILLLSILTVVHNHIWKIMLTVVVVVVVVGQIVYTIIIIIITHN